MKPLVYYCRWQQAVLRLRGRDKTAVWGHLVFTDENGVESQQSFTFELASCLLTLDEPAGKRSLQLDEMGVVI